MELDCVYIHHHLEMPGRRRRICGRSLADVVVWSGLAIAILAIAALVMAIVGLVQIDTVKQSIGMAGTSENIPVLKFGDNLEKISEDHYCVVSAAPPKGLQPRTSALSSSPLRVQGHLMVMYAKGHMPGPGPGTATSRDEPLPVSEPGGNLSCAQNIAAGFRWKTTQTLIIDPANNAGVSAELFTDSIIAATNEWQGRMQSPIFTKFDTSTPSDGFDVNQPDGKNEAMFGFIQAPGVLAVAITWGFLGNNVPVPEREIIETDIMFNLHFPWGDASANPGVFGIRGVGAHEVGHGIGFDHNLVDLATMFPSASEGESHQDDLLRCEAIGLCELYGETGTNCLKDVAPIPVPSAAAAMQRRYERAAVCAVMGTAAVAAR